MNHTILFVSLLLYYTISYANEVRFLKGQVFVNEKEISKGAKFQENDLIKVGPSSFAVLEIDDGSKVKVNENSELKIKLSTPTTPLSANLGSGSAFFKIRKILNEKMNSDKFKVVTRQVSFGVRGTEFFVSYGIDKSQDTSHDVWMCVNEGLVEAQSDKNKVFVKQGEGIQVKKDQISNPKPLPWTKKLNWKMDEGSEDLVNTVSIEEAYSNILDRDYD